MNKYVNYINYIDFYVMDQLQQTCATICDNKPHWKHCWSDREIMANKLADLLLNSDIENSVNCKWNVAADKFQCIDCIVEYLKVLKYETVNELLKRGLNLNLQVHMGVTCFTWQIGNAENDYVFSLLSRAILFQTPEQLCSWINIKDNMIRGVEEGWFCKSLKPYYVRQTALQLCVAKGYKNINGSGYQMEHSNYELTELLLSAGADKEIDYQEPYYGNTAIHIAYARRDFETCKLLETYKTERSLSIKNNNNKTPSEMSSMPYKDVKKLLIIHTCPDGHPNTYALDESLFKS